jgi:hypothetical protein
VSVVHELLYQRGFWLLLGAAMAYAPGLACKHVVEEPRHEHTPVKQVLTKDVMML